jgi:hypothetical protein
VATAALTRKPGQSFSERSTELGETLSNAGEKMSAAGIGLTLALTVPIAGFVFFGWAGLVIGLVLAVLFSGAAFRR